MRSKNKNVKKKITILTILLVKQIGKKYTIIYPMTIHYSIIKKLDNWFVKFIGKILKI